MLEHITLRNFKSWRELDLDLKPITIIFGTNSSGKTALLDSLLLLKQSAESYDRGRSLTYAGYADLGSFEDVIHGHDQSRHLAVALKWRPAEPAVFVEPVEGRPLPRITSEWLSYEAVWASHGDVQVQKLRYEADALHFELSRREDGRYEFNIGPLPLKKPLKRAHAGRPQLLSGPERRYGLPGQVNGDWPNLDLLEFNRQFETLMQALEYVGPLRNYPAREYLWTGEAPKSIGRDGKAAVDALLSKAKGGPPPSKRKTRTPQDTLDWVAHWLRDFGLASSFEVRSIGPGGRLYEVRLVVPGTDTQNNLPDVGFGVSQVLPIIVQLHFAPEGSILLFEQPEIHLHPRAAAALADLFLEVAHRRKLQLIIESHSEHLLRRLQRRIAEAEHPLAKPEHIGLHFCELRDGASQMTEVKVNPHGEITNWPKGFFGDALEDMTQMALAGVRRRAGGAGQ